MGLSEREFLAVQFTQMMDSAVFKQERENPTAGKDVELPPEDFIKIIKFLDKLRQQRCSHMSFDDMMQLVQDCMTDVLEVAKIFRAAQAGAERFTI